MALRIAITHYHLQRGGVTRVIENAVAALREEGIETVVLSGEPYEGKAKLNVQVVEELAYRDDFKGVSSARLAEKMREAAREGLGSDPDLWHVHNATLGKNAAFPYAVFRLLQDGARVLFQIHDFAEDGRPDRYKVLWQPCGEMEEAERRRRLYPHGPRAHYAALNGRDLGFLRQAGVPQDQLHLLPNPVSVPKLSAEEDIAAIKETLGAERLWLYPTRGIRRKNLGEMCLWAAIAPEGDLFASTLGPTNPQARPVYERWVEFAAEKKLPVRFGVGEEDDWSFDGLVRAAYALLTTSVAEGFGLAFLEPWEFGKALAGRNLPEVTGDFSELGLDLSGLYERLEVPLEWVGAEALRQRLREAMQDACAVYGMELNEEQVEEAFEAIVRDDRADFGRLDEPLQEKVVSILRETPSHKRDITPSKPGLNLSESVIQANAHQVLDNFSREAYGLRLKRAYESLLDHDEKTLEALDTRKLLRLFLDPKRFSLLRT